MERINIKGNKMVLEGLTEKDYMALARQGIQLMLSIDPVVLSRIRYLSQAIGVKEWLIIQNTIIDSWARQEARIIVKGHQPNQPMPEFAFQELEDGTKNVLTGKELFNTLVEMYKQQLTLPDDGTIRLDGNVISKSELLNFLKFE